MESNRRAAASTDVLAAGIKTTARQSKAHSQLQQHIASRYVLIHRAETILRGVLGDEQLIRMILEMHQLLIEQPLTQFPQISFTPWTDAMLREHYDPRKKHFFDRIRTTTTELDRANRVMTVIEAYLQVPDPDNPGQRILDTRAASSLERWSVHKCKLAADLEKMNKEKEEDLAAAIFSLIAAIAAVLGVNVAENVMRDARAAAGTVAVGGDALRSANIGSATAIGSAYDFYAMSGF